VNSAGVHTREDVTDTEVEVKDTVTRMPFSFADHAARFKLHREADSKNEMSLCG
jgi:hypothetical protein